ncbi:hypothetical protein GCM10007891_02130 [Methylophaga thalassica]|uniref:DUF2846 domain-containing protein n=1 Tax=Methylophaga thalassica TaxID=40223 RepID=A0ABQ5TRZ3_9GAMM|nr:DUF2846 domain-containing protein [Methylophaga thalassica]GLP98359.1 hypothetical protein GCM10007891_02130 [Methylophaga thalassica]
MKKVLFAAVLVAVTFLSGCASVPMESKENTELAKQFNTPSEGNSGLYVYRSGSFGGALKKDVWVDGDCLGETAPDMFFYKEVKGNEQHKIATESEFSPNDLLLDTETGKNYFIRQYMKIGVFVGGAGVELVDEEKGKKDISSLNMAKTGTCSK